jgi:hypothetical protein
MAPGGKVIVAGAVKGGSRYPNHRPDPCIPLFMAKADHQLSQVDTWNPASYQAHSVEAARLAHAAGKLMGAFSDTVLTVQRRRSGGKQVVQVIHQQVAVDAGGKAIVAGPLKGRGKAGGNRGGSK